MLRVLPEGQQYGDPYCWSVAFRVVDEATIEFVGAHEAPRQCQVRAIVRSLRERGLRVLRERKSGACTGKRVYQ